MPDEPDEPDEEEPDATDGASLVVNFCPSTVRVSPSVRPSLRCLVCAAASSSELAGSFSGPDVRGAYAGPPTAAPL